MVSPGVQTMLNLGWKETQITKFAWEKHFRSADVYDFLSSKLNLPEHFRVYHIF